MILGIVKGTVVATRKMQNLVGYKFLLVEPVYGTKRDMIVAGDTIGVNAPVRSSGDTKGTPGVTLRGPLGELTVPEGVIVADRHLHMTPAQAAAFGLADGDRVQIRINGLKPGIMGGVLVRASNKCALDFHIDTDDGNAFLLKQGQLVTVLGQEE